jgi:hydroxymethylglutaryl-CoA synthase
MLSEFGVPLRSTLSSFQTQHACAGGTAALQSVASLLAAGGRPGEKGLVVCTDIARYEARTTAEVTQGSGAAALVVETDPSLISLDLTSIGYCSRNVDDFFRPIGAETARVKGTYSMQNYKESLNEALLDHCDRRGVHPAEVLRETDILVLHTPFRNMPIVAMLQLLETHLGLSEIEAEAFLDARGFHAGVDVISGIGNTYNAAMYFVLAHSLAERRQSLGSRFVGSRVLLASYGSGSTMTVIGGQVEEKAAEVIAGWDLGQLQRTAREATVPEYERWVEGSALAAPEGLAGFHLRSVRSDGYRLYGHGPLVEVEEPAAADTVASAVSA